MGRHLELSDEDASAPVTVTLEYRIDEADREAFFELMRQRRQVILRHGVLHWALGQDADDPAIWVERFGRASWTDFLRHRNRRTLEEEQNLEAVMKLHKGSEPPRLRYFIERELAPQGSPLLPRMGASDPRWG
jgi:hypothetical protein